MAWQVAAFATGVAVILHGITELDRRSIPPKRPPRQQAELASAEPMRDQGQDESALLWVFGCLVIGAVEVATVEAVTPWPWLVSWTLLVAIAFRQACFPGRHGVHLATAGALAVALLALLVTHMGAEGFPPDSTMLALALAAPIGWQLVSLLPRSPSSRLFSIHAGAGLATAMLFVVASASLAPVVLQLAASLLLCFLVCIAAARLGVAVWLLAPMLITPVVQCAAAWSFDEPSRQAMMWVYGAHAVAVLMFTAWPFVLGKRARQTRWSYRVAALAGPTFFLTASYLHNDLWGRDFIAALPLALALVALGAVGATRHFGPEDPAVRRSAFAWLGACGLGFVTLAIPLQLRNEWVTIAWALQGVAVLALWRRLDHAGLKYLAIVLLGMVSMRLLLNPYVLDYHPRASLRIINWLSYTYLVPTACLVGAWALLRKLETPRRRSWEDFLQDRPLGSQLMVASAIVVLFAWLNLTIFDWFSVDRQLSLSLDRLPARDLSLSIGWAAYGLGLLALGMWRESKALRSASLVLVLITSGKVFLYDLAHLKDLYRVLSLVGLALSLIVISLSYKRFVFRDESPNDGDEPSEQEGV